MTKAIAKLLLGLASSGVMLANWWFTFGLWPKSWLAFALCTGALIVIAAMTLAVEMEGK